MTVTTYKNTSGDYTITVAEGTGNMTVNGNLNVAGNVTYIDVTDLVIQDPFIVLNASNSNVYLSNSGVLTHTSNSTYAGIRYNATSTNWEISSSTTNGTDGSWVNLATGNGAAFIAGTDTEIQYNESNNFGASANFTYDYTNNKLTVQGHQVLGNIGTTPVYVGNGVALYNNTQGAGGTGVFVINSSVNDELVSKTKAIIYSLIF